MAETELGQSSTEQMELWNMMSWTQSYGQRGMKLQRSAKILLGPAPGALHWLWGAVPGVGMARTQLSPVGTSNLGAGMWHEGGSSQGMVNTAKQDNIH